jgi:hypothetical protein
MIAYINMWKTLSMLPSLTPQRKTVNLPLA